MQFNGYPGSEEGVSSLFDRHFSGIDFGQLFDFENLAVPLHILFHTGVDAALSQQFYNNVLGFDGAAPEDMDGSVAHAILMQHLCSPSAFALFAWQDWMAMDGELRREKNLPRPRVAEAIGVTTQDVMDWESGVSAPTKEQCKLLAKLYGMRMTSLGRDKSIVASRPITAQYQQIGNTQIFKINEFVLKLRSRETTTNHVRHRWDTITTLKRGSNSYRTGTRVLGETLKHTITHVAIHDFSAMRCDIDICRVVGHKTVDGLKDLLDALASYRRQNLNGKCRRMLRSQELCYTSIEKAVLWFDERNSATLIT